ncbi:hypothetical protein, partial [Limnohabitans sp. WS1]|uniref:hypothetical protein n=1 Tax=Limnohabitans sp. WS1 TaxID=1100726 RepID=UPI000DD25C93
LCGARLPTQAQPLPWCGAWWPVQARALPCGPPGPVAFASGWVLACPCPGAVPCAGAGARVGWVLTLPLFDAPCAALCPPVQASPAPDL